MVWIAERDNILAVDLATLYTDVYLKNYGISKINKEEFSAGLQLEYSFIKESNFQI